MIVVLYCVLRFIVYEFLPAPDMENWIIRDFVMNGPRILCMVLALVFGFKRGLFQKQDFLPHRTAITLISVASVFFLFSAVLRSFFIDYCNYSYEALITIVMSSFVVGFFEEILFRGVLLKSYREAFGPRYAVVQSSLIFMVFHVQAQPYSSFPAIFLAGVLFACLRLEGVSLLWLSLLHSVYDILVLLWIPSDEARTTWIYVDLGTSGLLVLAYWVWFRWDSIKAEYSREGDV